MDPSDYAIFPFQRFPGPPRLSDLFSFLSTLFSKYLSPPEVDFALPLYLPVFYPPSCRE